LNIFIKGIRKWKEKVTRTKKNRHNCFRHLRRRNGRYLGLQPYGWWR